MAGLFDSFSRGVEQGRDNRRQRIIGQNITGAIGGDQNALSAILQADPNAGMQVQTYVGQQQAAQQKAKDDRLATLGKFANAFVQTKDPMIWKQMHPMLVEAGAPADMPADLADPNDLQGALQAAQSFAAMYGSAQQAEVPSAIRELQMLQQNPELAKLDMQRRQAGFGRPQLIQTKDGYAWATPEGASPLNYGGGQPAGPQSGQPFTIDPSLPPNVQASIRSNEQAWATAPDQSTATLPPTSAQGPRVMPAPKASAKSELERRLELAGQMGATPEEQKRMVVGGDNARDAQRISTSDATKARIKLTQIQTARQQLEAVKSAFAKLKGSYSAGPGGNLLPTPEGQAFDRAIRNLSPLITAVTRVPGVGAMSDFESKLQEAALPSRGTYESSTEQQIADLERLLDTVEGGYNDLLGGQSAVKAPAGAGGWSIKVKP